MCPPPPEKSKRSRYACARLHSLDGDGLVAAGDVADGHGLAVQSEPVLVLHDEQRVAPRTRERAPGTQRHLRRRGGEEEGESVSVRSDR